MRTSPEDVEKENILFSKTLQAMQELERGAIANPDENRQVGHYWLRDSDLAPSVEQKEAIGQALADIKRLSSSIHSGSLQGAGGTFTNVLLVGIGGSALGPQLLHQALTQGSGDKMAFSFLDNTDPVGIAQVLQSLDHCLGTTLTVVVSKSGGTKETRNGMLAAMHAYEAKGLKFSEHAVAVTGAGSQLDQFAASNHWIARLPMWDWVGGRTSVTSAVGLLPLALQGVDIGSFLNGAAAMDKATRDADVAKNPAAQMAVCWAIAGKAAGEKRLVSLPYRDRLGLLAKYLQQLVMESLGKRKDRNGEDVFQGLTVLGNKGSTDQHAYVQQLRDGSNDFFVTFIESLDEEGVDTLEVEPDVRIGDYLAGFYLGTRKALAEAGRESMTITLDTVSPFSIGALIALFERTVGLYAERVNINAYDQPGVEAGKKAAQATIELQKQVLAHLRSHKGQMFHVEHLASELDKSDEIEIIYKILRRIAQNPAQNIAAVAERTPAEAQFGHQST